MNDTFTLLALVPNLLRVMQTEKAVLFNHEETNEDLWIPKSQIFPEVEEVSSCFVGLSLWLVRKRGLRSFAIFNNRDFSLGWLRGQEKFYYGEKRRATLTKEERMAEVQAALSPLVARRVERLLLPGEEIEEAKERLPLAQGQETKERREQSTPKLITKKTRAMNLHFDDEE